MKYLSSNEVAKIWNITPTRVIALARKGKIEGAQRIGNRWMIPSTTTKPADGRTKYVKNVHNTYRFPLTIFGNYTEEDIHSFSKEEQLLYKAQVLYCNYQLEETKSILIELKNSTKNLYVKIGTLYLLCYTYWHTKELDNAYSSLYDLRKVFENNFPYKDENEFILIDVLSVFLGTKVFKDAIKLNHSAKYSNQAKVFFTTMATCNELFTMAEKKTVPNINLYEIICDKFESEHYFVVAMYMHYYIGGMYTLSKDSENASVHFEKAIELAVKHKLYVPLAEISFSNYSLLKPEIKKQPIEEQNCLDKLHNLMSEDFASIAERFGLKSIANKKLNDEDYRYIQYVTCDITNKQIATIEHVSESTVNKKFLSIYERLGISGKKQLFKLTISSWCDKEQ